MAKKGRGKTGARGGNKRTKYTLVWRNKFLTTEATSFDEMIEGLDSAVRDLRAMKGAGVVLEDDGGVEDDYATLSTTDPGVAERFGFEPDDGDDDDRYDDDDDD